AGAEVAAAPTATTVPGPETTASDKIIQVFKDDRNVIQPGDRVMLIVDDDSKFVQILQDLAHEYGFKALVSPTGSGAMPLARRYKPDVIALDIGLPDMDGWRLLDNFKRNPETRHIPVHVISVQETRERGMQSGAFSVLEKPVDRAALSETMQRTVEYLSRPVKRLLIVEDNDVQLSHITGVIGNGDVATMTAKSGEEALKLLAEEKFDCMILDLGLPDMSGMRVLEELRKVHPEPLPTLVYTARDLTPREEAKLRRLAESVIVKGTDSLHRLFDQSAMFLHRVVANLPEDKRIMLETIRQREPSLAGRRVLIVDDDIRNIFSLTSVLEQHQVEVMHAENGRDGIALLESNPNVDLVLMDIMMPEMDGFETMRAIRTRKQFKALPMIAITAKAMKGDREKCIEAGASDYVAKPVDIDQLLSTMRVWINRH
ncbi:MAG TPA: response regulator, partial [Alphaproteobacteria bacterium]|nr:response regulator [Alphaproteobacteria bacterium]